MQVELKQLVGVVVGGQVTDETPATIAHDMDEIRIADFQGKLRRVGFCPHADGAAVRFVRILTDEERTQVRDEVARQRTERGLTTSELTSQPPDPREIRRAVKRQGAKQ